jgi:hypothetical protein
MVDYETFKKSARYEIFADPMRVMLALYILDPDNRGLTYSQLTEAMKNDMTTDKISHGLDVFLESSEIEHETQLRGGHIVQAYKLAWHIRETFKDYIGQ